MSFHTIQVTRKHMLFQYALVQRVDIWHINGDRPNYGVGFGDVELEGVEPFSAGGVTPCGTLVDPG